MDSQTLWRKIGVNLAWNQRQSESQIYQFCRPVASGNCWMRILVMQGVKSRDQSHIASVLSFAILSSCCQLVSNTPASHTLADMNNRWKIGQDEIINKLGNFQLSGFAKLVGIIDIFSHSMDHLVTDSIYKWFIIQVCYQCWRWFPRMCQDRQGDLRRVLSPINLQKRSSAEM